VSAPTATRARHPLDPLDAAEIEHAVAVTRAHEQTRTLTFVSVCLREPDPARLDDPGLPREAFVVWLDRHAARTGETVIRLDESVVVSSSELDGAHAAFTSGEVELIDRLVRADPRFLKALEHRGLAPGQVEVGLFPAGNRRLSPSARGRRIFRTSCWIRDGRRPYTTPVEGIVAVVDVDTEQVLEVHDNGVVPIPPPAVDYRDGSAPMPRAGLRPLEIIQPEGPSFDHRGWSLGWQGWSMRLGFTPREGLVLYEVGYEQAGCRRPILYRASLSEMVVPYAHTSENHYDRSVFDVGEAMLGQYANSLRLGCDCLGVISYQSVIVNNSDGRPRTIENAICIHEEDDGVLWKHTDTASGEVEVRRSRRLVVSWFATLDNYDYGFYWYFRQDGSIEMEVKLTGIVLVEAVGDCPAIHGALVAPQLNGILHQHFFCFRLHMAVDGGPNRVYEQDAVPVSSGPKNPFGNSFDTRSTLLRSEAEAARDAAPLQARRWKIVNPEHHNALGTPTAYTLVPGGTVAPAADPSSSFLRRAGFVRHQLWVTRFDPGELFAAGDYPNLHAGGAGLPEWTSRDGPIVDDDLVLWYTCGHHHLPRPEDWPVMPVARVGFRLEPSGFFDLNPANDLRAPHALQAGGDHRSDCR
jgi:primary-amine oxidase